MGFEYSLVKQPVDQLLTNFFTLVVLAKTEMDARTLEIIVVKLLQRQGVYWCLDVARMPSFRI